jgi:hypothetical protein
LKIPETSVDRESLVAVEKSSEIWVTFGMIVDYFVMISYLADHVFLNVLHTLPGFDGDAIFLSLLYLAFWDWR